MLNIIAISYKNIGPFKDNTFSLFFKNGKFLIKAPIGTGKSFLFFDGPMYGLYKYNTRNLLNNQSNEGYIKMLFTFEQETWLITRYLTKAKVKESCSSTLYKINNYDTNHTENELLEKNIDIEDKIKRAGGILEKMEFKNESDLQQTFLSFLPPKEVFVNTVFLMQDSDNIFELLPSERLTVLKNVFGLLGIDEAKDILAEKKKEISYKLKAYSDTTKYNEKITTLIKEYKEKHEQIKKHLSYIEEIKNKLEQKKSFIEELDALENKITIQDLNIEYFGPDENLEIDKIIQIEKDNYQKNKNQLENVEEGIKNNQKKIDIKRQTIINLQKDNDDLEKNIKKTQEFSFEELKEGIQKIQNEITNINTSLPQAIFSSYLNKRQNNNDLQELGKSDILQDIESSYNIIKQLIEKGKSLQEKIKNNQLLIENEQLKQQHLKEKKESELKNIGQQIQSLQEQYKEIEINIRNFETSIEQQATFDCEKVGGQCPFIKIINKKTFDQLESQKQVFYEKRKSLEQQIKEKESQKLSIDNTNSDANQDTTNENISTYKKNIEDQQKTVNEIKSFLQEADRKNIEEKYQTYKTISKEKEIKEKKIEEQELFQKQKEEYITLQQKNKETIIHIEKEIEEVLNETNIILQQKETIQKTLIEIPYQQLIIGEQYNTQCTNIQRDISNTINEFKVLQREIEVLKNQEKQIANLYNIFSKELLLIVLQDHLPILNDIINSFLLQIVDYQVNLKLNKTSSDKLELEANIIDQQGEREIKSLSGGQKIILKLVRMLSISSYMNSPMLFLDETINNLDAETVGKVATMLEDFIKQRNIKFYTVTHNQQIQDMQIRDATIEVTR